MTASKRSGTLDVGPTSDLARRVWEHKNNVVPSSFRAQFNGRMPAYYKIHGT